MSDSINNTVLKFFLVLLGIACVVTAISIKRPSHHYTDMIKGWSCTKGTADMHTIPPDNCEQWTKL